MTMRRPVGTPESPSAPLNCGSSTSARLYEWPHEAQARRANDLRNNRSRRRSISNAMLNADDDDDAEADDEEEEEVARKRESKASACAARRGKPSRMNLRANNKQMWMELVNILRCGEGG